MQLSLDLRTSLVSPARMSDPVTSHEAAEANQDVRGAQRVKVCEHFKACGDYGSTDCETGIALNILRTSAGKRRKELCELGLIVDSGRRRETDTGSTAIVWIYSGGQ